MSKLTIYGRTTAKSCPSAQKISRLKSPSNHTCDTIGHFQKYYINNALKRKHSIIHILRSDDS